MNILNVYFNMIGALTVGFIFLVIVECTIVHLIDKHEKGEKYGK